MTNMEKLSQNLCIYCGRDKGSEAILCLDCKKEKEINMEVEALSKTFRAISYRLSYLDSQEDVYQEMVIVYLMDRDYLKDQTTAFIGRRCADRVRNHYRDQHNIPADSIYDPIGSDGDVIADTLPAANDPGSDWDRIIDRAREYVSYSRGRLSAVFGITDKQARRLQTVIRSL